MWHRYQRRMKIWVSKVQCTNKSYSKMSKSKQVPLYFSVSGVSLSKLPLLQCVLHGCQGCMKIWVSKVQCTNKSCSKKNKNMQMPLYLVLSNFVIVHYVMLGLHQNQSASLLNIRVSKIHLCTVKVIQFFTQQTIVAIMSPI